MPQQNDYDTDNDMVNDIGLIVFLPILYLGCFVILISLNIWGCIRYRRHRHPNIKILRFFLCVNFCCPCYVLYLLSRKMFRLPRKKSRPPKDDQTIVHPANCLFRTFNRILSCFFHYSPIGCHYSNSLSVNEAISRYAETEPIKFDDLIKRLKENKFLDLVLHLLNGQNANLFFKVLPSGSLRERYGKLLPSTSILGTDYDLMLIPDGIEVAESLQLNNQEVAVNIQTIIEDATIIETEPGRQIENLDSTRGPRGDITPLFEAVSDPNQNPETPTGYVWLKLLNTSMKSWNSLCFDRLTAVGVEKFLSQISVYNQIRGAIDGTIGKSLLFDISHEVGDLNIICKRSGPAFTIIVENKEEKWCIEYEEELFHCDFIFALYCPKFPKCAQDFFDRRQDPERRIFWPKAKIVDKIKHTGCHVVPKPSTKDLYSYTHEQKSQTFLSQGVALEFRYSFSQAEIILSDYIPDNARTVFLSFKGTIKKVVNYVHDRKGKFHRIPSYVLKTILLWKIETKPESYWNEADVLENFFMELLTSLRDSFETRICPMYWNPSLNLLQGMEDEDFIFISDRLQYIRDNMIEAIADDWLELERCVRLNCCKCCLRLNYQVNFFEKDLKRHNLCLMPCDYNQYNIYGGMPNDEDIIYAY